MNSPKKGPQIYILFDCKNLMSKNRIQVLRNDPISGAVIMPLFPEGGKKANYKSQLGVTVLHLVLMMNYVTEESRKEDTSHHNSTHIQHEGKHCTRFIH